MKDKIKKFIKSLLGIKESEWALRIQRDNDRVLELLKEKLTESSCCIDIGAHKGSFLALYLQHSPRGRHMAFEPLPFFYNQVRELYPRVSSYNVALSDFTGKSTFYNVKGAEAMSGFKRQHYPTDVEISEIEVQVQTLDSYIDEIRNVDFIKIDVEGAELSVLRGAINIIEKYQPMIMFEFAKLHTEAYIISPKEVFDFFDSRNYEIWRLDKEYKYNLEMLKEAFVNSHETGYDRNAETNFLAVPKV